jgi:hypothetical protein
VNDGFGSWMASPMTVADIGLRADTEVCPYKKMRTFSPFSGLRIE